MRPGGRRAPLILAALTLAWAARADDDLPRAPGATPQAGSDLAPKGEAPATKTVQAPRLHASHRVEVIAPGERVETIVDRMRADRSVSPMAKGSAPPAPPIRGPDRRGVRGPPDGFPGPNPSMPGPGGTMPPPRGDGPPPDRPHR